MNQDKPITVFDFLNSINHTKVDLGTEENLKVYNAYVINHCLSGSIDTVLAAADMNERHWLDPKMQYDFLRLSVRKKKRFNKWLKKEKIDKIETIKKYYGYNNQRAFEVADLISDSELRRMEKRLNLGGITKNKKSINTKVT